MKIPTPILVAIFAVFIPKVALSAGLSPWQFGMTREQVQSFSQFGPYKSFSNGDIETFIGVYRGHKHNVQFFFRNNHLVRIGVYLGEGSDRNKAIASFRQAYGMLERDYGKVIIPEVHVGKESEPVNADVLAIGAAANAVATGKTEALSVKQPNDVRFRRQL